MGSRGWLVLGLGLLGACGAAPNSSAQVTDTENTAAPESAATAGSAPDEDMAQQSTSTASGLCSGNTGKLSSAWAVSEIQQFEVLSRRASKSRPADPDPKNFSAFAKRALCKIGSDADNCLPGGPLPTLVASGTFNDTSGTVYGLTIRRGVADNVVQPADKIYGRGGLAQFSDGSFAICRPGESQGAQTVNSVSAVCGSKGGRVFEFLGGGALLIHRGAKVCSGTSVGSPCDKSADLASVQKFDQGGQGINAGQMRATQHTIVATKAGRAYLIWPTSSKTGKSGAAIQSELCAAGYDGVIKFDGGSGFYVRGSNTVGNGVNPSGLLIKIRK
ncbi:MAG: hypothetical protein JST16_18690 [Bdellovibrionales bacterium]|nr:hypothetical protein [Bdellovibrionales bacterium]